MTLRRAVTSAVAVTTLLLASACGGGGGDPLDDSSGGDKGKVTLSGQNFTEMQILAELYSQVLAKEGYDVEQKLVDTRPIYVKQLTSGDVQIAPDYLAGIGDYLNTQKNGETAKPVTTNSADESLDAIEPLVKEAGITLLQPAEATDQNAYAVTKEYADANSVKTLSDLAGLKKPIKLAAAKDCKDRQDCAKGLKSTYGLDITEVVPLGFGSPQGKDALKKDEAQLAQVATTDGTLEDDGLVLLEDDKGLQPAQNLVPAVNTKWIEKNKGAEDVLNSLSSKLTTDDLAELNAKVDNERQQAQDVAKEYLEEQGLL